MTAPAWAEHRPQPETSAESALGLSQSERDEMTSFTPARATADTNQGTKACTTPMSDPEASVDGLHRIKIMAESNPSFARALRSTCSTEAAAQLAQTHGIVVSPEALWRHRGTLTEAGLPTWRG